MDKPLTPSRRVRPVLMSMYGRTTPPSPTPALNSAKCLSDETPPPIGPRSSSLPKMASLTTSHPTSLFGVTTRSSQSTKTTSCLWPWNAWCTPSGVEQEPVNLDARGKKPVSKLTRKTRARSSGTVTEVKNTSSLMNSAAPYTSATCSAGWIVTRSLSKQSTAQPLWLLELYGLQATWTPENGTPPKEKKL